jgi:DNA-binding protein H-NS
MNTSATPTTTLTLEEIQQQIATLNVQKAQILEAEKGKVILRIRNDIALYGISPEDLFSSGGKKTKKSAPATVAGDKPVRYSGPNGETWAGGLGRKPTWVAQIINNGGNIEDYRIKENG